MDTNQEQSYNFRRKFINAAFAGCWIHLTLFFFLAEGLLRSVVLGVGSLAIAGAFLLLANTRTLLENESTTIYNLGAWLWGIGGFMYLIGIWK